VPSWKDFLRWPAEQAKASAVPNSSCRTALIAQPLSRFAPQAASSVLGFLCFTWWNLLALGLPPEPKTGGARLIVVGKLLKSLQPMAL
jgi:hypothetical protein